MGDSKYIKLAREIHGIDNYQDVFDNGRLYVTIGKNQMTGIGNCLEMADREIQSLKAQLKACEADKGRGGRP